LVVVEVFELLKTFGSSVKPVMFVGQSAKEKGGLPQKKQLEVNKNKILLYHNIIYSHCIKYYLF